MATPAIQTLLTDAQQVLNLNSLSEVRATMAAALANANVGTPLNPNLTTQQLWNQFYLIVRQPESDIESIITNQLMKFLFAPPAPGGVGGNHEVIYNNNGVLAGDPKFLWEDALNRLDIDGSATISGDLTVRTTGLIVNATGVGMGMTPAVSLDITNASAVIRATSSTGTNTSFAAFGNTGGAVRVGAENSAGGGLFTGSSAYSAVLGTTGAYSAHIGTNGNVRYSIDSTGISTWSVAGTTAMTLNSTGLGVGGSPNTGLLTVGATTNASATANGIFL